MDTPRHDESSVGPPDVRLAGRAIAGESNRAGSSIGVAGHEESVPQPVMTPVNDFAASVERAYPNLALPLEALGALDPDRRPPLVESLGAAATGAGVVALLQALVWGYDPDVRASALTALSRHDSAKASVTSAWLDLASGHPDAGVVRAARQALARLPVVPGRLALAPALRQTCRPVRGLVTAIDGSGRSLVGLLSQGGAYWVGAVFECDVECGVREVGGVESPERSGALEYLEGRVLAVPRDVSDGRPELAVALLRAALTRTGTGAPPALGYWLERACGRGLTPAPLNSRLNMAPVDDDGTAEVAERAGELLDALPDWWEDDHLTDELAREAVLRGADPGRDVGAIRILFERRLALRLDRYRRMLTWMGIYWYASGEPGFSQLALEFARQLDDPQNAVPRHPWIAEYARRSLRRAAGRIPNVTGRVPGLLGSSVEREEGGEAGES
jgi:hypothetical protein